MSDLDHNCCYELGIFVDTLSDIREALLTKTTVLKNEVIEIRYDTDGNGWKVCTGNASHNAWHETDVVLYCGGSRPVVLPTLNLPEEMRLQAMVNINNIIFHNLDYMVDPQYCKELVLQNLQHSAAVPRDSSHNSTNSPNQSSDVKLQNMKWVVVGNSHSAMLVMMNLYEAGVRNIVNFYRSDLRFMHDTTEGWRR